MDLDDHVNRFRLASRELFNQYFRVDDPYNNDGWTLEERFRAVQDLLFQKLVIESADLPSGEYGFLYTNIRVTLVSDFAPFMLNRETDSGYWDDPLKEVTRDAVLAFISFFDWDQLGYRDNRYVRVRVQEWTSHPTAVGRHALIQTQYVRYAEA